MGVRSNHPGMEALVALATQSPKDFAQGRNLEKGGDHVEKHPHLIEEFNLALADGATKLGMPLATVTNVVNTVLPALCRNLGGLASEQASQTQRQPSGLGYNVPEHTGGGKAAGDAR